MLVGILSYPVLCCFAFIWSEFHLPYPCLLSKRGLPITSIWRKQHEVDMWYHGTRATSHFHSLISAHFWSQSLLPYCGLSISVYSLFQRQWPYCILFELKSSALNFSTLHFCLNTYNSLAFFSLLQHSLKYSLFKHKIGNKVLSPERRLTDDSYLAVLVLHGWWLLLHIAFESSKYKRIIFIPSHG